MRRRRTIRCAAGAAVLAAGVAWAAHGAAAGERLIEGELVRVDLAKRTLVVRPAGGPPREVDVTADATTAITMSGRSASLEELKPVERIAVSCEGATSASCLARRVRAGPARHGVATPAALP